MVSRNETINTIAFNSIPRLLINTRLQKNAIDRQTCDRADLKLRLTQQTRLSLNYWSARR